MPRRGFRNVVRAYPGSLGVPTSKGYQVNYPHPLDAYTESAEIMVLRYDSGALSTDAPDPFDAYGGVTYQGLRVTDDNDLVFYGGA